MPALCVAHNKMETRGGVGQRGRDSILDKSRKPLTTGLGFQFLLRASGNRVLAAKDIHDCLLQYLDTDEGAVTTVVVCGIGDCSPCAWNVDVDSGTPSPLDPNSHRPPQGTPEGIEQGALSLDMTFSKCEGSYWLGENWVTSIRSSENGRCQPFTSSSTTLGTSSPMYTPIDTN